MAIPSLTLMRAALSRPLAVSRQAAVASFVALTDGILGTAVALWVAALYRGSTGPFGDRFITDARRRR